MIPLKRAKICVACEVLFEKLPQCPICGGTEGVTFLAKWIIPLDFIEKNPYDKLQKVANGQKEAA